MGFFEKYIAMWWMTSDFYARSNSSHRSVKQFAKEPYRYQEHNMSSVQETPEPSSIVHPPHWGPRVIRHPSKWELWWQNVGLLLRRSWALKSSREEKGKDTRGWTFSLKLDQTEQKATRVSLQVAFQPPTVLWCGSKSRSFNSDHFNKRFMICLYS